MKRFKPGKTYRTREGKTAQVLHDHGDAMVAPYRIMVRGDVYWANPDGHFREDQMLPGAIEDETKPLGPTDFMKEDGSIHRGPREVHDPEYDETRQKITDDLRAEIESGRRGLVYRLDMLAERLHELESSKQAFAMMQAHETLHRIQSLETRLTGIGGVSERLADSHLRLCAQAGRIDALERRWPPSPLTDPGHTQSISIPVPKLVPVRMKNGNGWKLTRPDGSTFCVLDDEPPNTPRG